MLRIGLISISLLACSPAAVLCWSRGCKCAPSFWLCTSSFAWCDEKLSPCSFDQNSWESEICLHRNWWCV